MLSFDVDVVHLINGFADDILLADSFFLGLGSPELIVDDHFLNFRLLFVVL